MYVTNMDDSNNRQDTASKNSIQCKRFRERKKSEVLFLLQLLFELFPTDGIQRCKVDCLKDNTVNYGLHQIDLGFANVEEEIGNGVSIGTRTLGQRYENEHTVRLHQRER
jgi:hypothetical protein